MSNWCHTNVVYRFGYIYFYTTSKMNVYKCRGDTKLKTVVLSPVLFARPKGKNCRLYIAADGSVFNAIVRNSREPGFCFCYHDQYWLCITLFLFSFIWRDFENEADAAAIYIRQLTYFHKNAAESTKPDAVVRTRLESKQYALVFEWYIRRNPWRHDGMSVPPPPQKKMMKRHQNARKASA